MTMTIMTDLVLKILVTTGDTHTLGKPPSVALEKRRNLGRWLRRSLSVAEMTIGRANPKQPNIYQEGSNSTSL
jgi:hypothetical protein